MAYNPYNTYKKIVARKGDWHNAQSLGQDPNQYYQAAIPLYQELYDNGYGDLADDLSRSNYTESKGLLSKYGLKPDEQFNVDNAYNDMTGGDASTTTAQSPKAYGADESTQKLLDQATGAGQGYQDFMNQARGIATGEIGTQPSQTVDNMLNAWSAGNDRLNGAIQYDANGNVISGLNTEHYNIGRNQLDYLNQFDVTKQPYYEGIMAQYKLGGENAANNAYANGAADNGGNIDSYAAANANRQQLAFTTAGQQAALAAAQQNQQNWQNLYAQMSQDLNSQGVLNANTLQQAAQLYSIDAQERMNALDVAGALQQQEMANAINGYITNVQADMQKYGIDAETAMNRENNQAALEQIMAQLAAQERMNTENNETTRLGYASQERMNSENNQTQRYGYDTERDIAGINSQTQLGVAGINRDSALGVAGINANASMSNAALNAEVEKWLGQLGYDQALAGYQNDYDIANLNNLSATELQKLVNKNAYDIAAMNNQSQLALQKLQNQQKDQSNNNTMTYEEALSLAAYLFREGSPELLNRYGMGTVTNMQTLTDWFEGYLGNRSDAAKAAKAIMDKDTGYPDGIKNIQKILNDYNSAAPVYDWSAIKGSGGSTISIQ